MNFAVDRIPHSLLMGDRPIDNEFYANEALFYRCLADHINGATVSGASVNLPDMSVNRERYGPPESVLIPVYLDWSIAAFAVSDIPNSWTKGDGTEVEIRIAHDPTPTNYPHCEIRIWNRGGARLAKLSTKVKRELRNEIAKAARVMHSGPLTSKALEVTISERAEERERLEALAIEQAGIGTDDAREHGEAI